MEKLTLAFIHGGTLIGLFSSLAHPIFWLIEAHIILIVNFVIIKLKQNHNIQELPFTLSLRILFLLMTTLYSSLIFTYFIDYWKEMIGCLSGCLIALWLDYLFIFYEKRVKIHPFAFLLIISKIGGIFTMNFSLLFYLEETKNNLFFIENIIGSIISFCVIMEIIYRNVNSILGIQIENLFNKYLIFAWTDFCFSGFLFLQGSSFPKEYYNEWKYGYIISMSCNVFSFLFMNFMKKKNNKVYPIVNRLKEVFIILQPDLDIKIGEKLSKK